MPLIHTELQLRLKTVTTFIGQFDPQPGLAVQGLFDTKCSLQSMKRHKNLGTLTQITVSVYVEN